MHTLWPSSGLESGRSSTEFSFTLSEPSERFEYNGSDATGRKVRRKFAFVCQESPLKIS